MKSGLRFVWTAFLIAGICSAQQRPRSPRLPTRAGPAYMQKLKTFEETPSVTRAVLRNGLTVVVNEFRSAAVVTIGTYVSSGWSDDPDRARGTFALITRMLGRGTAARAPGLMGREIAALGGELHLATEFDRSSLEITVPAMQWKKALEIAADAFLNPSFDPEETKRAVEQIRLEEARRFDDPDTLVYDSLLDLSLPSRGLPSQVNPGALSGVTPEALASAYKSAFTLPRTTLVVSGDVNAPDILTDVVRHYDKPVSQAGKRAPAEQAAGPAGFRYRELRAGVSQAQALFGFTAPPPNSPDTAAVEVLRAMLAAGDGSTLASRLRDRKKLINGAEGRLIQSSTWRVMALRIELDPANIDKSELALITELEIFRREDPDEDEVQRAIAQCEREFWEAQQTTTGRARMLEFFESLGGWKKMDQYLAQLREIKPADIRRVASRYLDYQNCSLLELLPLSAEARGLPGETVLKSFRELLETSVQQELDAREKETKPAVDGSRPSSFKFSEVRSGFLKASILRGPELFIHEDHTMPLIHMGFFFPGGKLAETPENNGITALMLRSLLGATGDKSAAQVYRQLEIYGGRLQPVIADDGFGFMFSVLSQNIDPALALLGQVITAPKFEDDYIALRKEQQLWRSRSARDSLGRAAEFLVDGALFRGHAYALSSEGTEAALKTLAPPAVRQWYKNTVEHRKPVVVIIGDTQGTTLAGYFVKNFSGSRFQDTVLPADFAKTPESGIVAEDKRGTRGSVVKVGFAAPPEGDEDGPVISALCGLLAGTGGRLQEQLEERQSLASSVSVSYEPRLRSGSVVATAFTFPGNEEKVLKVVQDEVRRVFEAPLLYKDYRTAVSAAIGRLQIAQQDRFYRIAMVTRSVLAGKGLEGAQEYTARIQEVSQDDLPDVARRVFDMRRSVTVTLHGRAD
jgi:zinc protease